MAQHNEYFLVLRDYDYHQVVARAPLTQPQVEAMVAEVTIYEEHIARLSDGTAPPSCYEDSEEQMGRYIAQHLKKYDGLAPRPSLRSLYEDFNVSMDLVDSSGNSMSSEGTEYDEEMWSRLVNSTPSYDESFFTSPLPSSGGFSIGYTVLPITRVMMSYRG